MFWKIIYKWGVFSSFPCLPDGTPVDQLLDYATDFTPHSIEIIGWQMKDNGTVNHQSSTDKIGGVNLCHLMTQGYQKVSANCSFGRGVLRCMLLIGCDLNPEMEFTPTPSTCSICHIYIYILALVVRWVKRSSSYIDGSLCCRRWLAGRLRVRPLWPTTSERQDEQWEDDQSVACVPGWGW